MEKIKVNENKFLFDWKLKCPFCEYINTIPGRYSCPERMRCFNCKKEFETNYK